MNEFLIGAVSALWLGILTSISPCPLATNVAAVSFLSKKIAHPALVFLSGLAYTLGRMLAYFGLSFIIASSLLSIPQAAQFLQKYMTKALGPLLIITGLVLSEVIKLKLPSFSLSHKHHSKLADSGALGAFVLGVIFALAFCPVSAALFFGTLMPLVIQSKMGSVLPFFYGIGTGLPVLVVAIALALGVTSLNHWFHKASRFEQIARKITGIIFIIAGVYYSGIYIVKLF